MLSAWAEDVFTESRPETKKPARAGFFVHRKRANKLCRRGTDPLRFPRSPWPGLPPGPDSQWPAAARALAGRRVAVVDLRVHRNRDLVRYVRAAYGQTREAQALCTDHSRLHADDTPGRVRRRRPASGSRGQARNESGNAQVLPEQVGFGGIRRSAPCAPGVVVLVLVRDRDDPVAVAGCRCLDGPARGGVLVVTRNGAVAVLVRGYGHGDSVEIVDHVFYLGLGDHFLALQDAAQEQPDDDEHDRDLDQGEAHLGRSLAVEDGFTHRHLLMKRL